MRKLSIGVAMFAAFLMVMLPVAASAQPQSKSHRAEVCARLAAKSAHNSGNSKVFARMEALGCNR